MKKKIITFMFMVCMISFTACGDNNTNVTQQPNSEQYVEQDEISNDDNDESSNITEEEKMGTDSTKNEKLDSEKTDTEEKSEGQMETYGGAVLNKADLKQKDSCTFLIPLL